MVVFTAGAGGEGGQHVSVMAWKGGCGGQNRTRAHQRAYSLLIIYMPEVCFHSDIIASFA